MSNRYAVIGINKNGDDGWYTRFTLESGLQGIIDYASQFLPFNDRMEIWVVTEKDEKVKLEWDSHPMRMSLAEFKSIFYPRNECE